MLLLYMYQIKLRTLKIAKQMGVDVYPSDNPKYKLDVYDKRGLFIARIGDINYDDYPTYIQKYGTPYANERRRLYMLRHKKDIQSGRGRLAFLLLWS